MRIDTSLSRSPSFPRYGQGDIEIASRQGKLPSVRRTLSPRLLTASPPYRFHQNFTLISSTGKHSLYRIPLAEEARMNMIPRLPERRPRGRTGANQAGRSRELVNTPDDMLPRKRLGRRQWGGRGSWVGGDWGGGGGRPGGWWDGVDQPEQGATITATLPQETQTQTVIVTTGNAPTTQVIVTTQRHLDPPPSLPALPSATGAPASGPAGVSSTGTEGRPANIVKPQQSQVTETRGLPVGSRTNTLESGILTPSGSATVSAPSTGINIFPNDGGGNSNASASQSSQVPVGAIVGSVLGALILILVAVLLWLCLLRRLRRQAQIADAYPFNGAAQGNSAGVTTTAVPPELPAEPTMSSRPPILSLIMTKGPLFASQSTFPSVSSGSGPVLQSPLDREEVMRAIHTLQAFSPIGEHRPPEDPRVTEAVEALQTFLSQNRNTMSEFGGSSILNPPPAYQERSSRISRQQRQSMADHSSKLSV